MGDEGKIENEIFNYSVNRGNKYNQMKNERKLRKLGTESCPDAIVAKVGAEANSVPTQNCYHQWFENSC